MSTPPVTQERPAYGPLIRTGGALMMVGMAIHIVANFVLKELPPVDASFDDVRSYLDAEAATWSIVHGMRYPAIACLAVFYGGLVARVRCGDRGSAGGWEFVGLVGAVLHLANILIANGLETLAFKDFALLSERPELFWFAYNATRALFDAEIAVWAIVMAGFGIAAWRAGGLPKWIVALGFVSATFATIASVFAGVATESAAVSIMFEIAAFSGLAWFLGAGATMLLKGAS